MGPLFTWLYLKEDGSQIRERLDRVLAMVEWYHLFPMAKHIFHHQLQIIPLLFFSCLLNQEKRGWVGFSGLNQCG